MASLVPGSIDELHAASRDYSRTHAALSLRNKPEIPDPAIFAGLKVVTPNDNDHADLFPSVAHCAVHLELLEAFKVLRECVIQSNQLDVLFDTMPKRQYTISRQWRSGRYVHRKVLLKPVKEHDVTFGQRRKAKWMGFVNYAFLRFTSWASAIHHTRYNAITNKRNELSENYIPPLGISFSAPARACIKFSVDVLMVWHAFLLKPRLCRDWCKSTNIEWISRVNFPWKHIVSPRLLRSTVVLNQSSAYIDRFIG